MITADQLKEAIVGLNSIMGIRRAKGSSQAVIQVGDVFIDYQYYDDVLFMLALLRDRIDEIIKDCGEIDDARQVEEMGHW